MASARALYRNLLRESHKLTVRRVVIRRAFVFLLYQYIQCLQCVLRFLAQDYNFRMYASRRSRLGFDQAKSSSSPDALYQVSYMLTE
jgi:hypothetical protein